jgi:hypothetical protein
MCGTGTVTGGGAKHVGECGPALRQPQSAALWPFGYFTATKRDARRQQRRVSGGSIRALAQDQEPGSASGETRSGPTHGDKEFKQKRLAL